MPTETTKIIAKAPFFMRVGKEKVNSDIKTIVPEFEVLTKDKKEFLIQMYLKSYEYGTKVVKKESFYDFKNVICQELKERFDALDGVENNDLSFVKKLAEEDETTLDSVLKQTAAQEDFVYETYASNYIDKSTDVLRKITIPKGFEEIDVTLISQDAFSDGAMKKIDYLAKEVLSDWAVDLIEEM